MTFVSYAQNFEDVLLWRALRDVEHGRYLDIGAHDPVVDSLSRAFYESGWRGVHVEPMAFYARRLREARPDEIVIEAAVTDAIGPIPFYELGGLSSGCEDIAEHHKKSGHQPRATVVPTVGLDNLLELGDDDIHWLKIDVEGMEADVLRSWRDSRVRPWILVVESTYPNSERPTQYLWIDEVLRRGYQEVFFDGLSRYFLHESHVELEDRLNRPANVFDSYQITQQHFSAKQIGEDFSSLRQASEARETQQAALIREQLERIRDATAQVASLEQSSAAEIEGAQARLQVTETALAERCARLDELSARLHESGAEIGLLNTDLSSERNARVDLEAEIVEIARLADPDLVNLSGDGPHQRSVPRGLAYAAVKSRLDLATKELELLRDHAERQFSAGHGARDTEINFLNRQISDLQAEIADARELRDLLQQTRSESERRHFESDAALAVANAALERSQAELTRRSQERDAIQARANALIGPVIAERPDRWQRLGLALRLTSPSPASTALASWAASPLVDAAAGSTNHATYQPAGTDMLSPPAIRERNPYLRANSLAELLSWDDVNFVRCAYVTVLGRQPDKVGEGYYTGRVRQGRSKMEILWQLRRSEEGPKHDPGIAGFDRALHRARRARMRVVGGFFRILHGEEGDSAMDRRQRAMANDLHLLVSNYDAGAQKLQTSVERLERRLESLDIRISGLQSVGVSASEYVVEPTQRRLTDPIDLASASNPEEVLGLFKAAINSSSDVDNFRAGAQ